MSLCAYHCHEVGGPFIAENPECPIHGPAGQQAMQDREEVVREILCRVWCREISADEGFEEIDDLVWIGRPF